MKTFFKFLVLIALLGGIGFGVYGYKKHGSMSAHFDSVSKKVPVLKSVAGLFKKKEKEKRDPSQEDSYRNIEPEEEPADAERDQPDEDDTEDTDVTDRKEETEDQTDREEPAEEDDGPTNTSLSASRIETLNKKLEKSNQLIAEAEYKKAGNILDSFPWGEMPPEMEKTSREMRKKASQLQNVVEMMNLEHRESPPVLVEVKLYNGSTMKGMLVDEDPETLTIRMYGSDIIQKLEKVNLKNINKKSQEETKEKYRDKFVTRKRNIPEAPSVLELYNLAKFGLRHGLKKESGEILDRAWETSGGNLTAQVKNHLAGILYENYKFFKGRGQMEVARKKKKALLDQYPDSRYAKIVKGESVASRRRTNSDNDSSSSRDSNSSSSDSSSDSSGGSDGGDSGRSVRGNSFVSPNDYSSSSVKREVRKAIQIFDEAMGYFDTASNDSLSLDKRKQANNKARRKLVESRTHVMKAQKLVDGEDSALDSFFQEIQDKFGTCYRRAKVWAGFHRK